MTSQPTTPQSATPAPTTTHPTTSQPVTSQPTPHELVNPPQLAPAIGFSHAVAAVPGRTVYLGGQAGNHPDGTVDPEAPLVEQFDLALANMVATLTTAGAAPEHLVTVTVFAVLCRRIAATVMSGSSRALLSPTRMLRSFAGRLQREGVRCSNRDTRRSGDHA